MYARAYNVAPTDADIVSKQISKYEDKLKHAERDETTGELLEEVSIHDFVEEKYWDLLEGCKKYLGIKDTRKGHPCFLGEELVMTNKGYKQIKDIIIGDYVLTHKNRFMEVKDVMTNRSDDIYELRGVGIFKTKVTGNHPYYVKKSKNETPIWEEVSNVKKGDYIGVPINQEYKLSIHLLKALMKYCSSEDGNEYAFKTSDKKLALEMSYWVNKTYHKHCRFTYIEQDIETKEEYLVSFSKEEEQEYSFYENEYIWCKVGEINKTNLIEDTYNLSVIDDNSYTVNNIAVHNCGTLATDLNVEEEVGVILCKSETTKKEVLTACIESGNIDYFGWLKQDFLIVDVVGTTQAVYDRIGIKSHTVKELLELTDGDEKTWDIYAKGLTMCVNQVEKMGSRKKTMQYKPKNEVELCALIAGIRPSFASLLKIFLKREEFSYNIESLDKLIQTPEMPYTFILYQEQLMQILGYAGFPMKATYDIVKSVSKKKTYCRECGVTGNSSMKTCPHCGSTNIAPLVDKFKKQFVEGFSKKIEGADNKEEVASNVWHIVEDFAGYGFNASHSYCMAIDSLNQAYLKAHYPLEFYETMLRRYAEKGEKDKVKALKDEMKYFGIKLGELKFGEDNRNFILDKETNTITQSLVAIKGVSQIVADQIYEIGKRKDEFNNFIEIRHVIKNECKGIKKNQLEALIDIGYFSDYGSISFLNKGLELYDDYYTRKTFNKTDTDFDNVIRKFSNKETLKQFKELDTLGIINYFLESEFNYISIIEKALIQFRAFGEIDIKDEEYSPTTCIVVDLEDRWKTRKVRFYNIMSGRTSEWIKIGGGYFDEQPMEIGQVVDMYHTIKLPKKVEVEVETEDEDGNIVIKKKWRNSKDETETWCDEYVVYGEEELEKLIKEEYDYKISQ